MDLAGSPMTVRMWIDVVRRARLGRTTKIVALMMATFADPDGSRVFPGVARLAVACELTYNVVQTALRKLREAGLIQVVRQASRQGRTDEYRLVLAADLLDRVEVLDPAQMTAAAHELAGRRRGRYRPASRAEPAAGLGEGDVHTTAKAAGEDNVAPLRTAGWGAGADAAPHGVGAAGRSAPHGGGCLHPAPIPPTIHGPFHHHDRPADDDALRTDVAVVGGGGVVELDAAGPRPPDGRCVHKLGGSTGVRCPACRRGLGTEPVDVRHSGAPRLRLVQSA